MTDQAPATDTRTCPLCAETIKAAAVKCRYCGADLSPSTATKIAHAPEAHAAPAAAATAPEVGIDTRVGLVHAKRNQEALGLVMFEVFVLASVTGFAAGSWWAFLGALVVLWGFTADKALGEVYGVLASGFWAYVCVKVVMFFGGSMLATIGFALAMFACSFGMHRLMLASYREHIRDFNQAPKN